MRLESTGTRFKKKKKDCKLDADVQGCHSCHLPEFCSLRHSTLVRCSLTLDSYSLETPTGPHGSFNKYPGYRQINEVDHPS